MNPWYDFSVEFLESLAFVASNTLKDIIFFICLFEFKFHLKVFEKENQSQKEKEKCKITFVIEIVISGGTIPLKNPIGPSWANVCFTQLVKEGNEWVCILALIFSNGYPTRVEVAPAKAEEIKMFNTGSFFLHNNNSLEKQ